MNLGGSSISKTVLPLPWFYHSICKFENQSLVFLFSLVLEVSWAVISMSLREPLQQHAICNRYCWSPCPMVLCWSHYRTVCCSILGRILGLYMGLLLLQTGRKILSIWGEGGTPYTAVVLFGGFGVVLLWGLHVQCIVYCRQLLPWAVQSESNVADMCMRSVVPERCLIVNCFGDTSRESSPFLHVGWSNLLRNIASKEGVSSSLSMAELISTSFLS